MGDYAKAEPLFKEALEIRQKVLGREHPDTAASLNNLAKLYWAMGDYAKAEPLYKEALEIRQKVLGPEHPDTATSLNNLAYLELDLGKIREAKRLGQLGYAAGRQSIFPNPFVRFRGPATRLPASLKSLHALCRARRRRILSWLVRFCTTKGSCSTRSSKIGLLAETSKEEANRELVEAIEGQETTCGAAVIADDSGLSQGS